MESSMEFRKSLHFAIKCTFHFQTDRSLAKEKGTLLPKCGVENCVTVRNGCWLCGRRHQPFLASPVLPAHHAAVPPGTAPAQLCFRNYRNFVGCVVARKNDTAIC